MVWVIVVVVVVVLVVAGLILLYNRLVRLRNRTQNAWAQVDVQLKRRYDLVPNLVETVKGYATHERETFEAVTTARTAAQAAQGVDQQAQAENVLTAALGRLMAVSEAYPELRASENFQQLQGQLVDIEQNIAVTRLPSRDIETICPWQAKLVTKAVASPSVRRTDVEPVPLITTAPGAKSLPASSFSS